MATMSPSAGASMVREDRLPSSSTSCNGCMKMPAFAASLTSASTEAPLDCSPRAGRAIMILRESHFGASSSNTGMCSREAMMHRNSACWMMYAVDSGPSVSYNGATYKDWDRQASSSRVSEKTIDYGRTRATIPAICHSALFCAQIPTPYLSSSAMPIRECNSRIPLPNSWRRWATSA
jgi:hypothetical protein